MTLKTLILLERCLVVHVDKKMIREASQKYNLPIGYINTLVRRNIISVPFSHIDYLILNAFSKTWRSKTLLKISMSQLPKSERAKLLEPMSRLESFIYTRLCNFYKENKTLTTSQLLYELSSHGFKIPKQPSKLKKLKRRIRSLRERCKRALKSQQ